MKFLDQPAWARLSEKLNLPDDAELVQLHVRPGRLSLWAGNPPPLECLWNRETKEGEVVALCETYGLDPMTTLGFIIEVHRGAVARLIPTIALEIPDTYIFVDHLVSLRG